MLLPIKLLSQSLPKNSKVLFNKAIKGNTKLIQYYCKSSTNTMVNKSSTTRSYKETKLIYYSSKI